MMMRDDLDQFRSEPPTFGEQSPAITVREAQTPLLSFVQRNPFGFGHFESRSEFLRQDPKVDDDSNVMKKPCKIGLCGIAQLEHARQLPADQSASHRVLPKYHGIEAGLVLREQVQHSARHRNVADVLKSQADYCFA